MAYKPYTHAIGAGVGAVIPIQQPASGFTFVAEAECWVCPLPLQVNNVTPAAPAATPAPTVGNTVAGWLHLQPNQAITIPADSSASQELAWLLVWGVGAGGALAGYLQIIPTRF